MCLLVTVPSLVVLLVIRSKRTNVCYDYMYGNIACSDANNAVMFFLNVF